MRDHEPRRHEQVDDPLAKGKPAEDLDGPIAATGHTVGPAGGPPPDTIPPSMIRSLQRFAGNRATAAFVQRNGGPAASTTVPRAGATAIAKLDEELTALIVSERTIIALIQGMSGPDLAMVKARYRDKLAKQLNFKEMKQVVVVPGLKLSLAEKLEWLEKAALAVVAIGYDEIGDLVRAATQPERDALKTGRWQKFFATVCKLNNIVDAVYDLKFDLETQFNWIKGEAIMMGLSWAKVKKLFSPLRAPTELAAISTPVWQAWWNQLCNKNDMAELVDILFKPEQLITKLQWMHGKGCDFGLMRIKVGAAPPDVRLLLYPDAGMRAIFITLCNDAQFVDLTILIGGTIVQKMEWHAEKGGWKVIRLGLLAIPDAERPKLYADTAVKDLLFARLSPADLVEAVGVLGGTLTQKLQWLIAKGVDAALIRPVIANSPAQGRDALFADAAVTAWLKGLPDAVLGDFLRLLGGTPRQHMDIFGPTRPIAALSWASPSQVWVDAILAVRTNPMDMLTVAGRDLAWAPFIKTKLADMVRPASVTVFGTDAVNMVWAAYNGGGDFNAADTLNVFRALYKTPLNTTSPLIFSKGTNAAGAQLRERYNVVTPDDATARMLMKTIKAIPRSQVAISPISFCDHYFDETLPAGKTKWKGPKSELRTSFFWQNKIVIRASSAGHMDETIINRDRLDNAGAYGVGAALPAGSTAQSYFQNHVRHEIGHAVGQRPIGRMTTSGDDFAWTYGRWATESAGTFEGAMWSAQTAPSTGWPKLDFGGGERTVTDAEVKAWLMGLLSAKSEVAGPIRNGTKSLSGKLATLTGTGSLWAGQQLTKYISAIVSEGIANPGSVADRAFRFPGYSPVGPVHIYSTREGDRFMTYSLKAFADNKSATGWYSLSSHKEMFAEIYTRKYSGGTLPGEDNGCNWETFFTQLEAQEDPMFGAPAPAAPATTP